MKLNNILLDWVAEDIGLRGDWMRYWFKFAQRLAKLWAKELLSKDKERVIEGCVASGLISHQAKISDFRVNR